MSGSVWVDLVILVVALLAALSGYRQGAAASALAFFGVVLGAVAGILLAPVVIERFDDARLRLLIGVVLIVVFVIIGEVAGMVLGGAVRSSIHSPGLRRVDSWIGSVLQVIAIVIAAWLLAFPLRSTDEFRLSSAIDGSKVIQTVDKVAPQWVRDLPDEFTGLVDSSGLKEVIGPFGQTRVANVGPPDAALVDQPAVRSAKRSVVKISGVARSCGQALEGSGFVVSPERVMTNAHVVAGTDTVSVQTSAGGDYEATVVWFNPRNDVAVLDVPGLRAPALEFASGQAQTGDDAIALGYPENGPFTVTPLRVRNVVELNGPDIYQSPRQVQRQVYTVRGNIRSGNSGGPMISTDGKVLGVVFGAAEDPTEDTGFVLTAEQVQRDLAASEQSDSEAATQQCVSG
ncbi:MarP family serine protease [Gordonia sp. PS3]|uniref:Peptidase S1 family protein n=1 Tax=Gordonia sihwensis NBRC 108236 TaxID=1223544 RepID=L7LLH0_9ACTN|nr:MULTISPECIES: MarP family serine protease [Gordonia]AUH67734.1 serine protease [Gordonia sp. YC-JH1]KJR09431.1 serine protease [Gordonia sihwensis]KXT58211.1 serine protease [Gordonia sp. QH-12]WFN92587.1 MarP family serine protease [Gordonia sihwensis]GAC61960.1 peptidase S1 family protein [Gordonia sihwensis NBRC 108236]